MIYVDFLIDYGWKLGASCHMMADSLDELNSFAKSIGLKPEWIDKKGQVLHYDLTASKRKIAIQKGAIDIQDRKQLSEIYNRLKEVPELKPTINKQL